MVTFIRIVLEEDRWFYIIFDAFATRKGFEFASWSYIFAYFYVICGIALSLPVELW